MKRVRVKKGQLDYFKKLAKKTKNEIQGYLVGRVVSPDLTIIDRIAYPKRYETQTPENVCWYQSDLDELKKKVEEQGYTILGDIHSHPDYWPVLSETDYRNQVVLGYRIAGICATMKGKAVIYFWLADCALPCDIEYV